MIGRTHAPETKTNEEEEPIRNRFSSSSSSFLRVICPEQLIAGVSVSVTLSLSLLLLLLKLIHGGCI